MNRIIKFRGRTIPFKEEDYDYEGEWKYGFLHIDGNGIPYIIENKDRGRCYPGWKVIPESVGQYTGRKTRMGTEIYEGDYLSQEPRTRWKVVWSPLNDGWVCMRYILPHGEDKWIEGSGYPLGHSISGLLMYDFDIVSNVHDENKTLKGDSKNG